MKINEEDLVPFDYEAGEDDAVRQLRPVLYRREGLYCCLLGPDQQSGILGRGSSAEEALSDWIAALTARIAAPGEQDEVAGYAKDQLGISKDDVW